MELVKKEKIRILQFSIASAMGGQTQYIMVLWKFINKDLFHMDFVTFSRKNCL